MKKKNNYFFYLLICLLCLIISGCSKSNEGNYINFYNYDGSLLWKTEKKDGVAPFYDGPEPTREEDDKYIYICKGWYPDLIDDTNSVNRYAIYDQELKKFEVTFYDYNDRLIATKSVNYGENIYNIKDVIPTRPPENKNAIGYRFSGWVSQEDANDLTYVTKDIEVKASYEQFHINLVKFYDEDGSFLKQIMVEDGGTIDYSLDKNNYIDFDEDHYKCFKGWDKSLENITSDLTVTAVYRFVNAYTVTFKNFDGTTLGKCKVPEGGTAEYIGATPKRASDRAGNFEYIYTFKGWSNPTTNIYSNKTLYAEFEQEVYNYKYSSVISTIKNLLKTKGGLSDGQYGLLYDMHSYSASLFTGVVQMPSNGGRVDIWMTQIVNDGAGVVSVHIFLNDNWNNGYFDFTYQHIDYDSYGTRCEDWGTGTFYGPSFSNGSKIYFTTYKEELFTESVGAYNCSLLMGIALHYFALFSNDWSMVDLGFDNYNY